MNPSKIELFGACLAFVGLILVIYTLLSYVALPLFLLLPTPGKVCVTGIILFIIGGTMID